MEDELLSCPYNRSHHIHRSRMSIHLTKCSKAHKGSKLVCPLDARHLLDEQEYASHLLCCPNRRLIEGARYYFDNELPNGISVVSTANASGTSSLDKQDPFPGNGKSFPPKRIWWNGLPPQNEECCCQQPECSQPREDPPVEENWDHLVGKVQYNPDKQSKLKPVLRVPQGKTKSERKRFRQQERLRYVALTKKQHTV